MKPKWEQLGARVGVAVCLLGFLLIFIGWNGAASLDRITAQFPYLISGGLTGLGLVVLGAALIVVETSRGERDRLREEISELRAAIEGLGAQTMRAPTAKTPPKAQPDGRGPFVAGLHSYHRPTCKLLEGQATRGRVTAEEAAHLGLYPCRLCEPSQASSLPRP